MYLLALLSVIFVVSIFSGLVFAGVHYISRVVMTTGGTNGTTQMEIEASAYWSNGSSQHNTTASIGPYVYGITGLSSSANTRFYYSSSASGTPEQNKYVSNSGSPNAYAAAYVANTYYPLRNAWAVSTSSYYYGSASDSGTVYHQQYTG